MVSYHMAGVKTHEAMHEWLSSCACIRRCRSIMIKSCSGLHCRRCCILLCPPLYAQIATCILHINSNHSCSILQLQQSSAAVLCDDCMVAAMVSSDGCALHRRNSARAPVFVISSGHVKKPQQESDPKPQLGPDPEPQHQHSALWHPGPKALCRLPWSVFL